MICAGSGAIPVAIIGRFLLTKYLTIPSEIAAADYQIDEVQDHLASERPQLVTPGRRHSPGLIAP